MWLESTEQREDRCEMQLEEQISQWFSREGLCLGLGHREDKERARSELESEFADRLAMGGKKGESKISLRFSVS